MKSFLALSLVIVIAGFHSTCFAQDDGKRKIEEEMENFKKQYQVDFEAFKEKREREIKQLEQDYQDYYNDLVGLKKYFVEKKDTANANIVADLIVYEETICKTVGNPIRITEKVVIAADGSKDVPASKMPYIPDYIENLPSTSIPDLAPDNSNKQGSKMNAIQGVESAPIPVEGESVSLTEIPPTSTKPNIEEKKETTLVPLPQEGNDVPSITPLPKGKAIITSPFGERIHPILRTRKMHTGMDFGIAMNTEIYASADGKVVLAQYSRTAGNWVIVEHKNGYSSVYDHLNKFKVKKGDTVKRGDVVGLSGNTGRSTGPHLHYEVRIKGTPVNPDGYLTHKQFR